MNISEALASVMTDLSLGLKSESGEVLNEFISSGLPNQAFLVVSSEIAEAFVQESQSVSKVLIRSMDGLSEMVLNSAQDD
jgi:hypothetical protein